MDRIISQKVLRISQLALLAAAQISAWGQASQQVDVKQAKVVYVSGNDLIVKTAAGKVKHFVVPKDYKFNVDGKQLATADLVPGTILTETVTTTSMDRTVTSVQHIKGKVFEVSPPSSVIVTTDKGNKRFRVPDGTKFNIDGQRQTVFDLRPGMNLDATIVTSEPETDVSRKGTIAGKAPPPTPDVVGVLLIEEVDTVVTRP